jgi:hypothetical protein
VPIRQESTSSAECHRFRLGALAGWPRGPPFTDFHDQGVIGVLPQDAQSIVRTIQAINNNALEERAVPVLEQAGGWRNANSAFGGRLAEVLAETNRAIAA